MRKLLIVSPHFPPKNLPDSNRVRTSLRYYRKHGWEPTVLCVSPETSEGVDDPLLAQSLPADLELHTCDAWREESCRRFGFGALGYRALLPLYRAGTALLKEQHYDVVLFSSTIFNVFVFGPLWKRRFGCRIVYDFQDPWYEGSHLSYTRRTVPGRWWKYRLDQYLAGIFEKFSLKSADHILSVSEGYIAKLKARYPWLTSAKFTLMPFGAAPADRDFVRQTHVRQSVFSPSDNEIKWVSAGRAGADMNGLLRIFFLELWALRQREPAFAKRLRIYFVGTDYAQGGRNRRLVAPLAEELGVGDMVVEHSHRIPYFESLALYEDSDAVLIFGSERADYTASKLFSCLLGQKPVLAMFHQDSLVARIGKRFSSLRLVVFRDPKDVEFSRDLAGAMEWLKSAHIDISRLDAELTSWTAEKLTESQCAIFDAICDPS